MDPLERDSTWHDNLLRTWRVSIGGTCKKGGFGDYSASGAMCRYLDANLPNLLRGRVRRRVGDEINILGWLYFRNPRCKLGNNTSKRGYEYEWRLTKIEEAWLSFYVDIGHCTLGY
jgi:hypothetical protein